MRIGKVKSDTYDNRERRHDDFAGDGDCKDEYNVS